MNTEETVKKKHYLMTIMATTSNYWHFLIFSWYNSDMKIMRAPKHILIGFKVCSERLNEYLAMLLKPGPVARYSISPSIEFAIIFSATWT